MSTATLGTGNAATVVDYERHTHDIVVDPGLIEASLALPPGVEAQTLDNVLTVGGGQVEQVTVKLTSHESVPAPTSAAVALDQDRGLPGVVGPALAMPSVSPDRFAHGPRRANTNTLKVANPRVGDGRLQRNAHSIIFKNQYGGPTQAVTPQDALARLSPGARRAAGYRPARAYGVLRGLRPSLLRTAAFTEVLRHHGRDTGRPTVERTSSVVAFVNTRQLAPVMAAVATGIEAQHRNSLNANDDNGLPRQDAQATEATTPLGFVPYPTWNQPERPDRIYANANVSLQQFRPA